MWNRKSILLYQSWQKYFYFFLLTNYILIKVLVLTEVKTRSVNKYTVSRYYYFLSTEDFHPYKKRLKIHNDLVNRSPKL